MSPAGPSRSSAANAGWGCRQLGDFRKLRPLPGRFSWLRPGPLLAARNDWLARWLGDPTDEMRREWLRRLPGLLTAVQPAPRVDLAERMIERFAGRDRVSMALLGDAGEGDASQYAVVPVLLEAAGDTDLAVLCGDVIYPAGGIRAYEDRFYRPYADYSGPIYGVPGNHDWYDGLTGFMTTFCDVPPDAGPPPPGGRGGRAALRRLLWRRPATVTVADVAGMRWYRDADSQLAVQPGPYCVIDTGPVRLVLIDTGITGRIDADQGRWLRRVSTTSPKPKILLTGKPIYSYAALQPCPIVDEAGGTVGDVNEIVTDPACNYVAVIGGDDHNYQRYPLRLHDGRTILYLVNGGGGAYLSATHQIPNVDALAPACHEENFRCYPLRGDSLAHFSRRYDALLRFGSGRLTISPHDATTLMAERIGITPPRTGTPPEQISRRARRAARRVYPLPARGAPAAHNLMSVFFDSDRPPMFKSFLRVDASAAEIVIDCWAATGCREHEREPVLEDRMRARPDASGRWCWTSETPGRSVP
ncbi:metallophosphoesterase family protein [Pseudonocardia asaccharolytica]|uniref:Metallophosphoesterase n=1 Tax=Pseudonocardia asaccharolytica DSM 44247 = NBRC 16224 TaxID=1123024 RepID=A0A511CY61_9PSEU|nr:metallophosphoesterase family protein [Pseudonocardia asaccharolytica]GEL16174.1 metallophosphoesterase [Pseudonocardia asaccharolytica DSM 44247 = NBRC 16224]